MSKIQVVKGSWNETCTVSNNLTENQIKFPAIRDVMEFAEGRQVTALIASGVKTPYEAADMEGHRTKIGKIPKDKLIGDNAYRYEIMGRIQKSSIINKQVGAADATGGFQLSVRDNYWTPGMNIRLFSGRHARIQALPGGGSTNYIYSLQMTDGLPFSYATDVAAQDGEKTAFPAYNTNPEKSPRGYGRTHYPDTFINHTSIKRKTVSISGSAATDVLWVSYKGQKGWYWFAEQQARAQCKREDEYEKWEGTSTMRDANGVLLPQSTIIDPETGNPVIAGDGIIPQIEGGNLAFGSASDGSATIEDINDMMTTLEKRSNYTSGLMWYVVTGTEGYNKWQELMEDKATKFNITINKDGSQVIGGPEVAVGYNFTTYNVNGNQAVVIKHTLFDDEELYTERGSDGKILKSSEMIFLDQSSYNGRSNMEILSKGAFGASRREVSQYLNGLTGLKMGNAVSGVDAIEWNYLKEDMIVIYNSRSCGILRKTA